MKKTVCIDFDGVIHDHKNPVPGQKMGPAIPGALEAIQMLNKRYKVVIYSVWAGNPDAIRLWLAFYNTRVDDITNKKPQADIYVDDKALRFTDDWIETLARIEELI